MFLKRRQNWRYKNTTLLVLSLIVFFYLLNQGFSQTFIQNVGNLGYFGSFVSGLFFVSVFTVAPASAVLFEISKTLNLYGVAVVAGMGAVLGDYIILRFLKDRVFEELYPLFKKAKGSLWANFFASPFFSWTIPLIGAIIIVSPLPDEIGISLMGLSKIKNWQFILVTFLLNSTGIFVILSLAQTW